MKSTNQTILKPHPWQEIALEFLKERNQAILAIDMRLGKTRIILDYLKHIKDVAGGGLLNAVIVCPKNVKAVWLKEAIKWQSNLTVGNKSPVQKTIPDIYKFDLTVIHFEQLKNLRLKRHKPLSVVVVDESHFIKSMKSIRTRLCGKLLLKAKIKIAMSGTVIPNRPIELYPIVKALGIVKMDWFAFGMMFCAGWKAPWGWDFSGKSNVETLREILKPHVLRLSKDKVMEKPVDKEINIVAFSHPSLKAFNLKTAALGMMPFSLESINKKIAAGRALAFEGVSSLMLEHSRAKIPLMVDYIRNEMKKVKKLVVFGWHIEILEEVFKQLGEFNPVILYGKTKDADRVLLVNKFQSDFKCRIFLGNLKTAGVGINLDKGNKILFLETNWSFGDVIQASERTWKVGKNERIVVDILTIKDSIDQYVLKRLLEKKQVISEILD